MVQWEAVKRVTVTEQIMEQIAQFITQGKLKAGDKLPNERDLAVQLGVTRGRVREALRALSLVGLITIRPGEGSFVNQQQMPLHEDTIVWMFHNEIHNLEEVYAARKLIESEVYATAADQLSEADLLHLRTILHKVSNIAHQEPALVLAQLDVFDLYVGEMCGNGIYFKLMQTIVHLRRETSLNILKVPGAIENSIRARTLLLDALATADIHKVKSAAHDFFLSSQTLYQTLLSE